MRHHRAEPAEQAGGAVGGRAERRLQHRRGQEQRVLLRVVASVDLVRRHAIPPRHRSGPSSAFGGRVGLLDEAS